MFKKKLVRKNALAFSHLWAPARILFLTKAGERCFCKSLFLLSPTPPSKCRLFWMKRQECITPTLHRGSCVGAARKVSPNWSLETMTCHSSHCFSIVWGQGNAPLVTSLSSSCYMSPPRGGCLRRNRSKPSAVADSGRGPGPLIFRLRVWMTCLPS